MIDKNENVITLADIVKRCYHFIKDNTAQIALVIPIVAALFVWIINYYFYTSDLGYYGYFGIDSELMLPFDKFSIYQNIVSFALLVLYWAYALFTVRMFKIKRNFLCKFILLILIPLFISCVLSFNNKIDLSFVIAIILWMLLQWVMIFAFGYCFNISFVYDMQNKGKKKRVVKRMWGHKEYRLFAVILLIICCIMIFYNRYSIGRASASKKRRFGIVRIEETDYAVIDANENKMILQQCEQNEKNLIIDADTYLCLPNNAVIVNYKTFDDVKLLGITQ